jgi:hypothetical protein
MSRWLTNRRLEPRERGWPRVSRSKSGRVIQRGPRGAVRSLSRLPRVGRVLEAALATEGNGPGRSTCGGRERGVGLGRCSVNGRRMECPRR